MSSSFNTTRIVGKVSSLLDVIPGTQFTDAEIIEIFDRAMVELFSPQPALTSRQEDVLVREVARHLRQWQRDREDLR